ncbi:MAG TPA: glycosyltransferase family 2 protein [Candidatus Sulfotelmatobacter sp.]|nr:glycosyltransferase family 2 protein [Candidatus Sulfotelmatobacter sp.]
MTQNTTQSAQDSISVFFPFHNEQENVRRVYESAREVLGKMGLDYEIILVDDGSTDQTPQIVDAIAARDARVKVVHHKAKSGYGAALQSGFRAATKTLVFYTDGDCQFDLNELPPLLPLMKEYDIVTPYRLNRKENARRRLYAYLWTWLICTLFGLKIRDMNCAFKLYKRKIFDEIKMESKGTLLNSEILARAKRRGFTMTQVGVHHYPRAAGKAGPKTKVIFKAFWELGRVYWKIRAEG